MTSVRAAAGAVVLLALGGALASCSGSSDAGGAAAKARGLAPKVSHRLPGRRFVAGCADPRVTGGLPPDYRRKSIVAGAVALYPARGGYASATRDDFAPVSELGSPRRYSAFDVAVTVAARARVTVAIPRAQSGRLALLFDHDRFSDADRGYSIAEGDRAVTFPGCYRPYTQFQGGFVVSRPQCARIEIIDSRARPKSITIGFGRKRCGPRPD